MSFTDEQLTTMRQELGLPEDADEATIVAALSEALTERAEPEPDNSTTTVPEGFMLVPTTGFEEVTNQAIAGAAAFEQLRVQERTRFLDAHRDRFLPANRADWETRYDTAETETRAYLEKAPVLFALTELGHDVVPVGQSNTDDGWFPQFDQPTTEKGA